MALPAKYDSTANTHHVYVFRYVAIREEIPGQGDNLCSNNSNRNMSKPETCWKQEPESEMLRDDV